MQGEPSREPTFRDHLRTLDRLVMEGLLPPDSMAALTQALGELAAPFDHPCFYPADQNDSDSWKAQARCYGLGREFFAPEGSPQAVAAQRICSFCPVVRECIRDALRFDDPGLEHGIRGGFTAREQQEMRDMAKSRGLRG